MTTTVNLRKLLHRKAWEMCTPAPSSTGNGAFVVSDKFNLLPNSLAYYVNGVSGIFRYDGDEDAWLQLPNSGASGGFAAGANGEMRSLGAMGGIFTQTATAGSTTTITTNRTIVRSLTGRRIRVIAGAGVGYDGTIDTNSIGPNAVITVTPASAVSFDSTTQYQVFSGSLWLFVPGTAGVGFSVYDLATNSWTARSVTGLPTSFGTDGQLTSTIGSAASFASGTATAGATTTLTNSGKNWLTNQWANYQIRITGGTGKGQIRMIASNTGTVITVGTAWTVNPDATSTYSIEGNEDYMYLIGNNAVTMYRFQVSTNTWTTLAPSTARSASAAAGCTLSWVDGVSGWTLPSNEQPRNIFNNQLYAQNGRYLYSFTGGGASRLDVYDIATNTWINGLGYGNQNETFNNGTSVCDLDGMIYIQKESSGRIFRFNVEQNVMQAFSTCLHPQGTAATGQRMFMLPYQDGGTKINFLYTIPHSRNELLRIMVI